MHPDVAAMPVIVIEATWGSSPDGVHIKLVAIVDAPSWRHPRFTEVELAIIPAGRAHTGPAWPEAGDAIALGEHLSQELGVPFHFAARDRPNDEVIRWWSRGTGHACDDCGLELDQNPAVHWFGMCYGCHVARELHQPRVHVEPRPDVSARDYDHIREVVDRALHEARSGRFYAGSQLAGAQAIMFLTSDPRGAARTAVAALRDAGLVDRVRVRAVASASDTGELVWPASG